MCKSNYIFIYLLSAFITQINFITESLYKKITKDPVYKHSMLLIRFFVFKFALGLADIVTDILTAHSFFINGHIYWGCLTLAFVMAPFIARLALFISSKIVSKRDPTQGLGEKETLKDMLWHFPLFSPVK